MKIKFPKEVSFISGMDVPAGKCLVHATDREDFYVIDEVRKEYEDATGVLPSVVLARIIIIGLGVSFAGAYIFGPAASLLMIVISILTATLGYSFQRMKYETAWVKLAYEGAIDPSNEKLKNVKIIEYASSSGSTFPGSAMLKEIERTDSIPTEGCLAKICTISRNLLIQREHIENASDFSDVYSQSALTHPIYFNKYMIDDMATLIECVELPENTPDYHYALKLIEKFQEISTSEIEIRYKSATERASINT